MEEKNFNTTVGLATVWSFATEIAAKLIVPVTNMILARILAPEAFGVIATVNIIVSFADTLSAAGFQKYLVQHNYKSDEELHNSANVAFWSNLLISILLWMFITINNQWIAEKVGNAGYGVALAVAAITIPLTSLPSVQETLCQRNFNFKGLFYRRLIVCVIPFFVTIPLALLGMRHWALIIGSIATNVVKGIILTYKSQWTPKFFYSVSLLREMLSFGIWTLIEAILMWASSNIDILIISNSLGDYYTGLYKNSQSTVTGILSIITASTTAVLFSALSRKQSNKKEFQRLFYAFQKKVAILVIPIGVGVFCFRELITWILLGEKWMEASTFVGIWGLSTALVAVWGTFVREAYRAIGKPEISLVAQTLHLLFVIPVCMIGVKLGFEKLIYLRSFAYMQIILVHMFFMKVSLKMSPWKMIWQVKELVFSAVIMGGIGSLLLSINGNYFLQFLYIPICAVSYFAILFLFPSYREMVVEYLDMAKSFIKRGGI